MRAIILAAFYSSILLITASCSSIIDTRGHTINTEDLKQVVEGQSTKEDIQALFGSPSITSSFGNDIWYYISVTKERFAFYAPEVTKQHVFAFTYNEAGALDHYDEFKLEDGKLVDFVEKTTPTAGKSLTAVEQLLGNLGRFNAPGTTPGSRGGGIGGPGR